MSLKLDYSFSGKYDPNLTSVSYLELSAGPTNSASEVLEAMMIQPVPSNNITVYKMMDDIKEMLKYIFQTSSDFTLAGQVSGNGGNETMVTNLVDPGEKIIVASAGFWGMKVADMARRYNVDVVELNLPPGEVYTIQELEDAIIEHKPAALFVTHGDSSGGTLQPLEGLGKMCHKHNCLLAVDAVVSLAVSPIFVDRWEIDAINSATQKGIGAPAGMCLMSYSNRACEKIFNKKHPPPYYYDLKTLSKVWNCFGKPRTYIYTYNSNMLAAIRHALHLLCNEGLEKVWQRHQSAADLLIKRLESELGISHFIPKKENRFCGVSLVKLPEGVKWSMLLDYILEKYHTEMGFGIGPTANKVIRIGLLGQNARTQIVDHIIKVLKDGIEYCLANPNDKPTTEYMSK